MELLEDPAFKIKYQKCKLRVKLWETDFMDKYGRRPNKNDIKEADVTIREAYKKYWKLKTQALEETLMDITFTDEEQIKVPESKSPKKTSVEEVSQEKTNCIDETKKNAENIDPHANLRVVNTSPQQDSECKNVDGVWGDHLRKSNEKSPKKRHSLLVGRSTSFQLSQNKFNSSSFTKRNPRKSLSAPRLKIKSDANSSRVSNASQQTDVDSQDGYDAVDDSKPVFGEAVKVTYTETKTAAHNINTVQQLIDGHTVNRNLNAGWLDRCAKQNNVEYPSFDLQRLSGTSDSGIESIESSIRNPVDNTPIVTDNNKSEVSFSDEEDFICNSDSEEERKNKRIRNFKKRLSDEGTNGNKRVCLEGSTTYTASQQTSNIISPPITNLANLTQSTQPQLQIDIPTKNDVELPNAEATALSKPETHNETVKNVVSAETKPIKSKDETSNVKEVEESDELEGPVKPVRKRKVRRRVKEILSDESDPEYNDDRKPRTKKEQAKEFNDDKKPRTKKERAKPTKPRATRKRTGALKGTNVVLAEDDESEPKKLPRRKKAAEADDEEAEGSEEEQKVKAPTIYGVETLQTVPRYAMKPSESGSLIQQFSETVSGVNRGEKEASSLPTKSKKKPTTDKEKLEQKIADGKINENFVRINIKKKVFVRGKKGFNFSKYKKNQWKQRKKDLASGEGGLDLADFVEKNGGTLTCFKCGETGHFARRCPNTKGEDLLALDEIDEGSQFPTLEEAQKMAEQEAMIAHGNRIERLPEKPSYSSQPLNELEESEELKEPLVPEQTGDEDLWKDIDDELLLTSHKIPEELASRLLPPEKGAVEPLYQVGQPTPPEVYETLRMFGHESFRPGQEKAVMRILSGQSTLVTLSTGSGKSLCYQLPAHLYSKNSSCITLVISPLVSLMDDQVTGIPPFLAAACLHTGQTPTVRENIMKLVSEGKIKVLLVSPEAVVAGEKSTGFGALMRQLPPIAFACIDEAHCISQWSHNFRPSYLMICRVLRHKLNVKTILALTATATKTNSENIVKHIEIPDGMAGVISDIPVPRNLYLSISKDVNRDQALIALLRSERFAKLNSIIIYCTRREECARVAGMVRVSLQDMHPPERPNVKVSAISEPYHAGLAAHRRKVVQNGFMTGHIKIIVATVAFGMGLNKSDIRAVIHYNMPATFEGYVQEVGRSGRDGLEAHCHLFLNPTENSDKWELQRHIYANGVDRHMIRRLLEKVFLPCSCAKLRGKSQKCPGHEVAIPIDETVIALDITEEMISTLLCYLELHPKKFITVLSSVYTKAKVSSYGGVQALKQAAQTSPPLAMAIAMDLQNGNSHDKSSVIEFPVVDVASAIGWDSGVVKSHLKNLEWKTVDGRYKRSSISVKYDTLGLRVKAPGDLTEDELDEALDALFARAQSQQNSSLKQLESISAALHKFAFPTFKQCLQVNDEVLQRSEDLKNVIREYFQEESTPFPIDLQSQEKVANEEQVAADVRSLIFSYRDNNFTGRAVARIFHGIQSPNYPAYVWGKCRFWRLHLSCNFNAICQIATREILAHR